MHLAAMGSTGNPCREAKSAQPNLNKLGQFQGSKITSTLHQNPRLTVPLFLAAQPLDLPTSPPHGILSLSGRRSSQRHCHGARLGDTRQGEDKVSSLAKRVSERGRHWPASCRMQEMKGQGGK